MPFIAVNSRRQHLHERERAAEIEEAIGAAESPGNHRAGQHDRLPNSARAIARVERLLTTPYGAFPLTQASLRLDPTWDPLRRHPRFKAIVEGPEPKTIYQ